MEFEPGNLKLSLIHPEGKRSLQALPRYFGSLKLGRKPTEDSGEQKASKLHQPLRRKFSLSAVQRRPVSGDTEQKNMCMGMGDIANQSAWTRRGSLRLV